jgi:hypothetical protein
MDHHDSRIKAAAAWGGVGVSKILEAIGIASWGDFAAMCAALYSLLLIFEWGWKKWKGHRK